MTPLELLNFYFSDGQSTGNKESKLWHRFNEMLNWDAILNKGYQADLCPLLYYILTKLNPGSELSVTSHQLSADSYQPWPQARNHEQRATSLSNDLIIQLRTHYYASLRRNMLLFDELNRVLTAFNEANIDVIILKGAELAERIYPDNALRPMSDIDLLVKLEDIEKAEDVLIQSAYDKVTLNHQKEHSFHKTYFKSGNTQSFVIELHWHLVRKIFFTQIDINELWAEVIPVNFLETEALTLSPTCSLLYLCWHGSRHGFTRFIWVCDIAHTIKNKIADIDWDLVREKSLDWKISKHFLFGYHMARMLLNNNFPVNKAERNGFSAVVKQICDYLALKNQHSYLERKNPQNVSNLLSWFLIQDSGDKVKHLFYRSFDRKISL